ncbi:MAG: hypothetical protein IJX17_06370 [Clostridia bacterium]|nr:hypothetical protein [Clostridia bacterium]
MKKINKILSIIIVAFIICIPVMFVLSGCKKPNNPNTPNNPNNSNSSITSAKDVVKKSISKMENIVYKDKETTEVVSYSFNSPNQTMDYTNELISILRGSGTSVYFTDYLLNRISNIQMNVVYEDIISNESLGIDDISFSFKLSEITSGFMLTLMNKSGEGEKLSVSLIKTYFIYDYELEKPIETVIVYQGDSFINVAAFDFTDDTAYAFDILLSENNEDFSEFLKNKNLNFENFKSLDLIKYNFIKINELEKIGYAFFKEEKESINVSENDVKELYTEIYDKIKDYVVPSDYLKLENKTSLLFYQDMYLYSRLKVSCVSYEDNIIDTFIDYANAKLILNQIKNELNKDNYEGSKVEEIKTEVDKMVNYINSIEEKDYVGLLSNEEKIVFLAKSALNNKNISYSIINANTNNVYLNIEIEEGNLKNIEI